ncbi:MAG: SUF system Fe-S cluster assembly regulator [Gammaproteobacteria bacterium]
MSKLTDYGTVVLAQMARTPDKRFTAPELAELTSVAAPTVAKLLKALGRAGLLDSLRGAHGGYSLARPPERISAVDIIDAIEGPVALTECSTGHSNCTIQADCSVGSNWQQINIGIRRALEGVSLAELARPMTIPLLDLRKRHVHP